MGWGSPKMDKKFPNVNITNFAEVYKGGRWKGGGEDSYPPKVDILPFFVFFNPFLKSTWLMIAFLAHDNLQIVKISSKPKQ